MKIKIGTSGFRYRVAFGLYANCKSWECQPAKAYELLVIGSKSAWYNQSAIEDEIATLEPRNGLAVATDMAKTLAHIQLDGWLRNLGQLMQRQISGRKVMRDDARNSMRMAKYNAKVLDMVMSAAFPSLKAAE